MVNSTEPKEKEKTRDDGCCGIFFLKSVIVIFNVIFLLSGAALLGVGIWTLLAKSHYVGLLATATFTATTYVLIGTGCAVFVLGIIGFVGALKEKRVLLMVYAFFLMIIFLLEAVAGTLAFIYSATLHGEIIRTYNNTILTNYNMDPTGVITNSVDSLQTEFKCCGTTSFRDWRGSKWMKDESLNKFGRKVPDSCCKTPSDRCAVRTHPSNIQYEGCIDKLEGHIKDHLFLIGCIGLGMCCLQIIGIIFACCLARQLKIWEYKKCAKDDPANQPYRNVYKYQYEFRNSNSNYN
ncbi:CD151 antigen-like [Lineus longissimus]|uniref:CD151 antigen-like n=1 Tax=Lineus longissimus TaxID=88925 RepID=UPI002B4C38F8